MSFGSGHIFEMISRLKYHQSLKKKRLKYFDGNGIYTDADKGKKVSLSKKITAKEKLLAAKRLQEMKLEYKVRMTLTLISSNIIAGMLLYFIYLFLSFIFL